MANDNLLVEALKLQRQSGADLIDCIRECFDADESTFEIDEEFDRRLASVKWKQEMFDLKIEGHIVRCDHTGEGVYVYLDDYKKPAEAGSGKQWAKNAVEIFVLRQWI